MKKIIAYSTLSQLGYMFVAAGLGAYWIALFHLATHAFFKSVLFLGAGNVMHATNDEINIKKMGGLKKHMPKTALIMTVASAALAGFPLMAGFFSKELILASAFSEHAYILWAVLWITAGLTAFYSFRLVMYVFHGKENYDHSKVHPHETYGFVIAAMTPLAILAVVAGFAEHTFVEFVTHTLPEYHPHLDSSTNTILMIITVALSLSGMWFAYYKFNKDGKYFGDALKHRFCYKLLANQYYMPAFIDKAILKPYLALSTFAWKFIDMKIIDATVDGIAKMVYSSGEASRVVQTGNLSKALKIMTLGILILLVVVLAFGLK
jgi:NADH-quinone oxidoreductase subunit L